MFMTTNQPGYIRTVPDFAILTVHARFFQVYVVVLFFASFSPRVCNGDFCLLFIFYILFDAQFPLLCDACNRVLQCVV